MREVFHSLILFLWSSSLVLKIRVSLTILASVAAIRISTSTTTTLIWITPSCTVGKSIHMFVLKIHSNIVGEDANIVGSVYQYQTTRGSCFMMAKEACSRGMLVLEFFLGSVYHIRIVLLQSSTMRISAVLIILKNHVS